MKTKTTDSPALVAARERYRSAAAALDEKRKACEELAADTSQEDRDAAGAAFDQALEQADAAKADEARLEKIQQSRYAHATPDAADADPDKGGKRDITITREPLAYEKHDMATSYLLDIARTRFKRGNVTAAEERLGEHRKQMQVEVKARDDYLTRKSTRDLEALIEQEIREGNINAYVAQQLMDQGLFNRTQESRAVSRLDGSAGEFVPPLWVLDEFAPAIRAARPFADRVRRLTLPGGTDSINVPIITVGGLTGFQAQDGQAVASRDWQTSSVLAPVRTVAGQLDVAMQVLDQSPIAFDQIAFGDLAADYALQLDAGCIAGTGGPGQLLGILNVTGIGSTAFTTGSPTAALAYPKLAGALNTVAGARKMPATEMWMHSQRYYWLASQLDTQGRPFLVPTVSGPLNAYGVMHNDQAQGDTGTNILGTDVLMDQSIPTNLGGGTNEDRVIMTRMQDHILFEGDMRTRALEEVLSGTLQVRFQVYAYVAFTAGRFPAGTGIVQGTGLATPTF
jgi:HK97 family phage major capsid protein